MKKEFKWEYESERTAPSYSNDKDFRKGGGYGNTGGYGTPIGYDNSFNKPSYEKEQKNTSGWGSVRDARAYIFFYKTIYSII